MWEFASKIVDPSVEGIAPVAARDKDAFSFRVQRRGSRPGLQPSEALGLFDQFLWVCVGLRECRLAEDAAEQSKPEAPRQWNGESPCHDITSGDLARVLKTFYNQEEAISRYKIVIAHSAAEIAYFAGRIG
jgi:hypothetical protein